MKTAFLIALFAFMFFSAIPPLEKLPPGCYMSFEELKNKTPSLKCKLQIQTRTKKNKFWTGGNDILLKSPDNCISKEQINQEMWAYSDGDSMYVNGRILKLQPYFDRVISYGRFIAFYDNEPTQETKNDVAAAAVLGGAIAAGVVAGNAAKSANRTLYVIDMNEAKRYFLDSAYLEKILTDYPVQQKEFKEEEKKNDRDVQVTYLKIINGVK